MTLAELERELGDAGLELRVVRVGQQWSAVLAGPGAEPVQALHFSLAGVIFKVLELAKAIAKARRIVGA